MGARQTGRSAREIVPPTWITLCRGGVALQLLQLSLALESAVKKGDQEALIPVIEAFVRTVEFMDRLREEGYVRDYALIGGLALSAWAEPRNTRDVDLVVAVADGTTWPGIAALVESGFRKKTVVKNGTRRST